LRSSALNPGRQTSARDRCGDHGRYPFGVDSHGSCTPVILSGLTVAEAGSVRTAPGGGAA
jgi:hypothetical protein